MAVAVPLAAGFWLRTRPAAGRQSRPLARGPWAMAYALPAVVAIALVQWGAVRPVKADVLFQYAYATFASALRTDDSARFEESQALFERVAAVAPGQARYYLLWGEAFAQLGERTLPDAQGAAAAFSRAQDYAARAEAAEPRLPYHAFNRGHVQLLFAQSLPEDQRGPVAANAADALQRAFNGAPTDPRIGLELATARLLAGDSKAARDMANYVAGLSPADPAVALTLGRIEEADGDAAAAEVAYQQALQASTGEARFTPLLALAELARRTGRMPTAAALYEEASNLKPSDWAVAFNLGLVYSEIGDRNKAMTFMGRALGMAPPTEQPRIQDAMDRMLQDG
jgi:Flp pilus assembly protein TadD